MQIKIRPVRIEDAPGINEIRRQPGVLDNMLALPSDSLKSSEEFIKNMGKNQFEFVAVIDENGKEKVVGNAGLLMNERPRIRHSGGIGIAVYKDYQSMGVGTKLMEALLDMADNWLMLVRVELTVYTDNIKAIGLYKKSGFEIEGTLRKAAIRRGKYEDLYMMSRIKNA